MRRIFTFVVILFLLASVTRDFFAASDVMAIEKEATVISVAVGQDAAAVEREEVLRRLLFNAVGKSNALEVKRLLELGAPIDGRDRYGWTALMRAAQGFGLIGSSKIDIVKMLIDAHADINSRANCGFTALMHACGDSKQDKVRLLLAAGADIDTQSRYGDTALIMASSYFCKAHHSTSIALEEQQNQAYLAHIRMLILAGANVALTKEGKTALDMMRKNGLEKEFLQAMEDKVLYESRYVKIFSLLTDHTLLPLVLVDLVTEYEVEEEYAFLLERERNIKKRLSEKR